MNQIWVTGDTHGDVSRLGFQSFPEGKDMDKSDVVEILGDFGLVWEQNESEYEKYWLDWLESKPFTTIATLGNHENYDRIKKLPVEKKFGAPVWVLRPSVFLLQSGYVYNINGKKVWNFNGAKSHDISDGILDGKDPNLKLNIKMMEMSGREMFRIEGISWWKDEIEQDSRIYKRGLRELDKVNNKVDIVFTHCAPNGTGSMLGFYDNDRLTNYLEEVHQKIEFGYWYFGHYHMNKTALPHEYCLFEQIERVA